MLIFDSCEQKLSVCPEHLVETEGLRLVEEEMEGEYLSARKYVSVAQVC